MTILQALLSFVVAATILTVTPGVDTAMVLRSAASAGPRPAAFASAGILLGCLVWGAAVSVGLGALLAAAPMAFTAVKWAGAAYLVYLGAKLVARPRSSFDTADPAARAQSPARLFRQGLLTNLLNPKIGIFYITFLPQFVPHGVNVAAFCFLLAVLHVVLTIGWFGMLIAATVPMGRFFRRPRVVERLDRITGGIFILFGARLALSR